MSDDGCELSVNIKRIALASVGEVRNFFRDTNVLPVNWSPIP